MASTEEEDARDYLVVVNDEEQYSIWLADRALPNGWRAVGDKRKKAECLKYIGEVWTDSTPRYRAGSLEPRLAKT
jgi:MbtH protein